MKKLLLSSCLLLAALACENPALQRDGLVEWTFVAPATKASIDGKGAFSWNSGDAIAVWNSTGNSFVTFSTASGNGIFSALAPANSSFTGTAFFPAASAVAANTISLPDSYSLQQLSDGAGIHMAAAVSDEDRLDFKHLTAYLTVQVSSGTSATIDRIVVGSDGHSLSGQFAVDGTDGIDITGGSAAISVSIPTQSAEAFSFTVPIPVGEYPIRITAGNESTPDMINLHTDAVNFQRARLYKLAPLSSQNSFSPTCEVYDITEDNNWE